LRSGSSCVSVLSVWAAIGRLGSSPFGDTAPVGWSDAVRVPGAVTGAGLPPVDDPGEPGDGDVLAGAAAAG
jgi:hypothetical protein